MNDDEADEDLGAWFASVAKEAANTPAAREIAGRQRSADAKLSREAQRRENARAAREKVLAADAAGLKRTAEMAARIEKNGELRREAAKNPAAAKLAAATFEAVSTGKASPLGAGLPAPWEMPGVVPAGSTRREFTAQPRPSREGQRRGRNAGGERVANQGHERYLGSPPKPRAGLEPRVYRNP